MNMTQPEAPRAGFFCAQGQASLEVLAADTNEPIPGLFAIGNTAGNFYGGVDYSMYMPGLSLGRAHTQGYVIGDYVAKL